MPGRVLSWGVALTCVRQISLTASPWPQVGGASWRLLAGDPEGLSDSPSCGGAGGAAEGETFHR